MSHKDGDQTSVDGDMANRSPWEWNTATAMVRPTGGAVCTLFPVIILLMKPRNITLRWLACATVTL